MKSPLPVVAIIGRPNVGKSTLFNRILGQKHAIVEDRPGVTRDRNFARAEWGGRRFYVVDTGGLEPSSDEVFAHVVRTQVLAAIREADLLVFVVDGEIGSHPADEQVADLLRQTNKPVLLVVNKLDRLPQETAQHEFWALGLGEPIPLSSATGRGSGDVLDRMVESLPPSAGDEPEDDALYVAVVGKPNVGKSSFINRLLGQDRLVVSELAGTTRDAIDTPMRYHGRTLVFIDTAGLRKHARIEPGIEYFSALRAERAIERADVCILLTDASEGELHVQDLKIAEKVWSAGKALILAVNKWDLVEKETGTAIVFERHIRERAPMLKWVPILFTSALTGQRVQRVLDLVLESAEQRARRIPTREVNEVVRELARRQPPPHYRGLPVKVLYATQVEKSPPTFVLFVNHAKSMTDSYLRFLVNGFREAWGFEGSPVRVRIRARREKKTV
ncbi:MAG: ribosome biogenesis GTPase Der [Longimicrobiales bacterium]